MTAIQNATYIRMLIATTNPQILIHFANIEFYLFQKSTIDLVFFGLFQIYLSISCIPVCN